MPVDCFDSYNIRLQERVCLHVKWKSFRSRREKSTSAAEKKESSEVTVVASSSRRLRTLSTWGKIRVPSLSVGKKQEKCGVVGVKISQAMKQMTNCWQRPPLGILLFFFFSFLSHLRKPNTTRTEVCQHTFRWNAAAKIFLQVVRSVQQRLKLLSKHFVAGFTLNTKWEQKTWGPAYFEFSQELDYIRWCFFVGKTKSTIYTSYNAPQRATSETLQVQQLRNFITTGGSPQAAPSRARLLLLDVERVWWRIFSACSHFCSASSNSSIPGEISATWLKTRTWINCFGRHWVMRHLAQRLAAKYLPIK